MPVMYSVILTIKTTIAIEEIINPAIAKPAESSFAIPIAPHIIPAIASPSGMIVNKIPISEVLSRKDSGERTKLTIPKTKAIIPSALPIFFTLYWFLSTFLFLFIEFLLNDDLNYLTERFIIKVFVIFEVTNLQLTAN